MTTAAAIIANARYDLRDLPKVQYSDAELLAFLNRSAEIVHGLLTDMESDLVLEEVDIDLDAGGAVVDLAEEGIPLAVPWRMSLVGKPVTLATNEDTKGFAIGAVGDPRYYWITKTRLKFWPAPSRMMTLRLEYFPRFAPLAAEDEMPFNGLFDTMITQSTIVFAENRNAQGNPVTAAVMDLARDRAMALVRKRAPRRYRERVRI